MNNQPIILNEYGSAILAFEDAWRHYAQEQGIVDPSMVRMRIIRARLQGAKSNEVMPTEEEYQEYKRLRDLFIAARVFDRFGYDKLVEFCGQRGLLVENGPGKEPCLSRDGQCHMDCWKFGKC